MSKATYNEYGLSLYQTQINEAKRLGRAIVMISLSELQMLLNTAQQGIEVERKCEKL